jgi:hypothetical protein
MLHNILGSHSCGYEEVCRTEYNVVKFVEITAI